MFFGVSNGQDARDRSTDAASIAGDLAPAIVLARARRERHFRTGASAA